ncbi:kinase-like domain-containing protein [Roridomyces roridus]|uniref:non-specific serine/threonine protein kinase n=1 Tax=Roridomyces roridus TaxID=1738132 RepID=A0AAD7G309_9AGAR|nr:kinase-like domain-containing protein [Roridomyces roridus]
MSHFSESYIPNLTGAAVDEGYLKLVKLISTSSFSRMYKAVDTTSYDEPDGPAYYAVKCMRNPIARTSMASATAREFRTHSTVNFTPGVVPFRRTFTDGPPVPLSSKDEFLFMVTDYCAGGNLQQAIERGVYDGKPVLTKRVWVELVDALMGCYEKGLVGHGALNPANVLLEERRKGVKLTDFGLARMVGDEEGSSESCGGVQNQAYMSPERTMGKSYDPCTDDTWALAMTLFVLLTQSTPWTVACPRTDVKYTAFRADHENYLLRVFPTVAPEANDFFVRCFDVDSALRPSLTQMRREVKKMACFKAVELKHTLTHSEGSYMLSSLATDSEAESSASSSAYSLLDAPNVGILSAPLIPTLLHRGCNTKTPTPECESTPKFRIIGPKSRTWLTDRLRRMGVHMR